MRLETLTVHTGRPVEPGTGALTPSITLATTFERAADGSFAHDVYTRLSNPNRTALETALTTLEGGTAAIALASGQAAAAAMLAALSTWAGLARAGEAGAASWARRPRGIRVSMSASASRAMLWRIVRFIAVLLLRGFREPASRSSRIR